MPPSPSGVCNTYLLHLYASRHPLSRHCTRHLHVPLQPHLPWGGVVAICAFVTPPRPDRTSRRPTNSYLPPPPRQLVRPWPTRTAACTTLTWALLSASSGCRRWATPKFKNVCGLHARPSSSGPSVCRRVLF
jgi:hypothetical protein